MSGEMVWAVTMLILIMVVIDRMHSDLIFTIFLIFTGAAVFATGALFTRQSLLVVYLILGMLIGPWGLQWVSDPTLVGQIGDIGIIFLLFLLGLHLHPQNLTRMLSKVTWITLIASLIFAASGYLIAHWWGLNTTDSLLIGAAMMFSSTIIGLKLLPASVLHNKHTGELMISVLLLQDIIAIIILLVVDTDLGGAEMWHHTALALLGFPLLVLVAFLGARFIIKLFKRFEDTQEYIFIVSIGWCLGMAQLAEWMDLSQNIGAFIAGVAIATSPIAFYIAESLKSLRDFFLILFFFAIGAGFNFHLLAEFYVPVLLLAGAILLLKPLVFYTLLRETAENRSIAWEVGTRLGQGSEFSLMLASIALGNMLISDTAAFLIYAMTILTFLLSSYIVVWRYPTPAAANSMAVSTSESENKKG